MNENEQVQVQEDKNQHITLEVYDQESGGWTHITYTNIIGHQVGQTWVAVITSEDETLVYKAENVLTIRVWKE